MAISIKFRQFTLGLSCFVAFSGGLVAQKQTEKLTEQFSTGKDVNIILNAENTNILFENWNKNEVSIVARLETEGLSDEQIAELKESWDITVDKENNTIQINSKGNAGRPVPLTRQSSGMLDNIVSASVAMLEPGIQQGLTSIQNHGLPFNASIDYSKLDNVNFDYDAYKREGEQYLKTYREEVSSKFGKDFNKIISQLKAQRTKALTSFAKNALSNMPRSPFGNLNFNNKAYHRNKKGYISILNSNLGTNATIAEVDRWLKEMENWKVNLGENFSESMEKWSRRYASAMENDLDSLNRSMDNSLSNENSTQNSQQSNFRQTVTRDASGAIIGSQISYSTQTVMPRGNNASIARTLIIRMPQQAQLDLNVQRGNLQVDEVKNAQLKLAYGGFTAKRITGDQTYLAVAYSPVEVEDWDLGTLQTNYVKRCIINNARDIKIDSRASNIMVNEVKSSAVIRGRFGSLDLQNLSGDFSKINVTLENSELYIGLPETAYNLTYNGNRSLLNYPKRIEARIMKGYDSQMLNGFYKSENSDRGITISSKFSEITLQ